jgi:hypothetical protein
MSWTWKWFDILVVIGAVAIGFAVFFIPNFMNTKEMKEFVAVQEERRAALAAYEARQAEIKREQEELGLVFVTPTQEKSTQQAPATRKGE